MRLALILILLVIVAVELYGIHQDIDKACGHDTPCHIQLEAPQ